MKKRQAKSWTVSLLFLAINDPLPPINSVDHWDKSMKPDPGLAVEANNKLEIFLKNGEMVPVSRSRYQGLQEALLDWNFRS